MANNQTEQLKAHALHLRNIKANLENQAVHSQIVLNGAKTLESLYANFSYSTENSHKLRAIGEYIIQALYNMFVPPAPPSMTKEMVEAALQNANVVVEDGETQVEEVSTIKEGENA